MKRLRGGLPKGDGWTAQSYIYPSRCRTTSASQADDESAAAGGGREARLEWERWASDVDLSTSFAGDARRKKMWQTDGNSAG